MKRLILVRHAKSDWTHQDILDVDRPLNQRGYEDAYFMSSVYASSFNLPELIVVSPAVRTFSTALIFAKAFNLNLSSIQINEALYEANEDTLLRQIYNLPDSFETVMMVGHNPGIGNLLNTLSENNFENFPTCGIVILEFQILSWLKINEVKGECIFHAFPKEFK